MTGAPTVWVLVHQLGDGGVPMALVRMLRWLEHADPELPRPEVHVIAAADGRHRAEVGRRTASTTVLGPAEGRSPAATVAAAAAQLGWPAPGAAVQERWARHHIRALPAPDVVLVHGAGAWPLWRALAPAAGRCRLVLHLHELAVAIGRSVPASELAALAAEPDTLASVCAPDPALAALLGARSEEVVVVPGCIDALPEAASSPPAQGAVDVVAVGEAGWRKGADRFEALAHELARRVPEATCRWVGAPVPGPWSLAVGPPSPLRWDGPSPDPWSTLAGRTVVVVPSREDPLPLVAIEAGGRGLPVVGSGDGELAELLGDDRGWFVPGGDVRALVTAVAAAIGDPGEAAARGAALRRHVDEHLTAARVGPRWLATVLGERTT